MPPRTKTGDILANPSQNRHLPIYDCRSHNRPRAADMSGLHTWACADCVIQRCRRRPRAEERGRESDPSGWWGERRFGRKGFAVFIVAIAGACWSRQLQQHPLHEVGRVCAGCHRRERVWKASVRRVRDRDGWSLIGGTFAGRRSHIRPRAGIMCAIRGRVEHWLRDLLKQCSTKSSRLLSTSPAD